MGYHRKFYKAFGGVLGKDLYDVFCECFERGCLPKTCQRAVLSLLPKNGDLGLWKNWRPVYLMCLDYKILSKCLANRLLLFFFCMLW